MKKVMPLLLASILLAVTPAYGKYDPSLRWRTLETAHFLIHHHQGEEETARTLAGLAEEVHDRLAGRIGWVPRQRTHVVLADSMDYANGMASTMPYNQIILFLTQPLEEPGFGLVPMDDWLRLVFTHEYTHVLQIDMIRRFPAILQKIFGRFYFPNMFQPYWLVEGLATYEETEGTAGGRGRSPATDMILRMAVLEKRFPTLGQAGAMPDFWPGGDIPYLFGEAFIRFIVERYGREKLAEISRLYSGRLVPFLVSRTGRDVLKKSYPQLWREWQAALREKYEKQLQEVQASGPTVSVPLTSRGYFNIFPAYPPDGASLAYTVDNADEFPGIFMARADGTGEERLTDNVTSLSASGSGIAWDPLGRGLYYTKLEAHRSYSLYNDLRYYDLEKETETALTSGLRARDPHPSPNGKKLVFVTSRLGKTRLAMLELDGRSRWPASPDEVTFLTEESANQYANPRWSPDGSRIAVSVWQPGGYKDIWILDAAGRLLTEVTHDRALDGAPSWSADGRYLFFSSDRTGIFNVFAYDATGRQIFQVTNVVGGAFSPCPSPDDMKLAFAGYSSRGFDIQAMELDRKSWRAAAPYRDPYPESRYENRRVEAPSTGYRPWSTLCPRFWLPWSGYSPESGDLFGIYTYGGDVLQRHTYYLEALYGPETGRFTYALDYFYDGFYPSLRLQASDADVTYPKLLEDSSYEDDYIERQQTLALSATWPLIKIPFQHYLTLGWRRREFSGLSDVSPCFCGVTPAEGVLSSLLLEYEFNSAKRYGYSISPEDGRMIQLVWERSDPAFGSDWKMDRATADWQEYLPFFWNHHVLKARGFMGYSWGDDLPQRAFQLGGDTPGDIVLSPELETVSLRGYPPNSFRGRKAALFSLEYRFPVLNIERGGNTTPFFLRRLHGALFFEAGEAWDDDFETSDVKKSLGLEARLDLTLGFVFPLTVRTVLARGLDDEGETQFYNGIWIQF